MAANDSSQSPQEHPAGVRVVRQSWADFTQATTLHGLKYVFEPPFILRRMLWCLVVLAAIATFITQVSIRTLDYFDYETNVDFKVVYGDDITFPAVTVCNQNNFRLTSVVDMGLYDFIEAVYSTDNITNFDFSLYDLDGIDAVAMFNEAAHQKTDFIVSCSWKGKPCDITNDFVSMATGLGLCYTFNAALTADALTADEPGLKSGLSLVLNLEQYEYTLGPQSDVGVKMLLHGQSEYPAMDNLGFAVASGTHTLVAIQTTVIENLPSPYGNCNETGVSMSTCLQDCRTRQLIKKCQCREPHMAPMAEFPSDTCSLEQIFGCARHDGQEVVNRTACGCRTPCKDTKYEAYLSYAQLSRHNMERTILAGVAERNHLWYRQTVASETFQQVNELTRNLDGQEYADMANYTAILEEDLADAYRTITSEHQHLIEALSDTLKHDTYELEDGRDRVLAMSTEYYRAFQRVQTTLPEFVTQLGSDLGLSDPSVETVFDQMQDCVDDISDDETTGGSGSPSCENWLQVGLSTLYGHYINGADAFDWLERISSWYMNVTEEIFAGSHVNISDVVEHQKCVASFSKIIMGENRTVYSAILNAMLKAIFVDDNGESTFVDDIDDHLEAVQNLTDLYISSRLQLAEANDAADEVDVGCQWLYHSYNQWELGFSEALDIIMTEAARARALNSALTTSVLPGISSMLDLLHNRVYPMLNETSLYMDGKLQKLQLFRSLEEDVYRSSPKALTDVTQSLLDQVGSLVSELEILKEQLRKGFGQILSLKMPVLKAAQLDNLGFIKLARSLDDVILNDLVDELYTDPNAAETMGLVITGVVDTLLRPMRNFRHALTEIPAKLYSVMHQQQTRLEMFAEELDLDEQFFGSNFLKVDVYYPEIKYDMIKQFAAFGVLSLLGEVGGFMGLLLGASAVTAFELLDYIIMNVVSRLSGKK